MCPRVRVCGDVCAYVCSACTCTLTSADFSTHVFTLAVVTLAVFALDAGVPRWMAGTLSTQALTYKKTQIVLTPAQSFRDVFYMSPFSYRHCRRAEWLILYTDRSAWQNVSRHSGKSLCESFTCMDTHTPTRAHTLREAVILFQSVCHQGMNRVSIYNVFRYRMQYLLDDLSCWWENLHTQAEMSAPNCNIVFYYNRKELLVGCPMFEAL